MEKKAKANISTEVHSKRDAGAQKVKDDNIYKEVKG